MRTPSGIDCPFFYGDYYRGKNVEECRLIGNKPSPHNWTPDLCATCPVPAIKRANACENMQLTPEIVRKFPFLKRSVKITAYCTKSQSLVTVPQIGCGQCHPIIKH